MKKLHVMHIITGLGVGGAERVVLEMAKQLSARDLESVVVGLNSNRGLLEQYPILDIHIYSLKLIKNPLIFIKSVVMLKQIIQKEKITIIHAHMFHSLIFGLICKVLQPGLKLVFTSHSSKGFTSMRRMVISLTKGFRDADVIFMIGQHIEMNARKSVVIPNGVQVPQNIIIKTKENRHRRVFLFVARFEPAKNPVALIRAFSAMESKNCELWMAGDGVLRSDVVREIRLLGIGDRVLLLGVRNDVSELLEQADCFVMSSRWEGLPMAMLEAGAIALPVICPPVGAVEALLDDDCGYLVEVSNLHNAFDEVLDDYPEARRRGKRLQEKIIKN